MKAVILCGGKGTRIQEATGGLIPKPLVEIGGKPILWYIMSRYAAFNIKDFILCLGTLGDMIKNYFLNYDEINCDITVKLGSPGNIIYHGAHLDSDWNVTLANTGIDSLTGARLAKVQKYVGDETFMMTYGDGVSNIDFNKLLEFHKSHGKAATVTGVDPLGRFGRLHLDGNKVSSFEEKPSKNTGSKINGGFFVFEPKVFDYVSTDPMCMFEGAPLKNLANDGELIMYNHEGFWQCMDTYRDLLLLQSLWEQGNAPWDC